MASTVTLLTYSNADFVSPFQYQDGSGNPIPITGWLLSLMVRSAPADLRVWASISSPSNGIGITDAVNGKYKITIPKSSLVAMPAGTYVHDLIGLKPDGSVETIWTGTVVHAIGVTR